MLSTGFYESVDLVMVMPQWACRQHGQSEAMVVERISQQANSTCHVIHQDTGDKVVTHAQL